MPARENRLSTRTAVKFFQRNDEPIRLMVPSALETQQEPPYV